jgi:hypothetical protein
MSQQAEIILPLAQKPRLKFIDMARSIAILMMLEGHFTGSSLADRYRDPDNWLYNFWHNLHGLTSPLFFCVTGVVFVYLLSNSTSKPYFDNDRVKKGFGRVRMLLFWGYLIQFDLLSFFRDTGYGFERYGKMENVSFFEMIGSWFHDILVPFYPTAYSVKPWIFDYHFDWFQAFHVLQSIGFGIFLLLSIFGIYKLIKKGPLYLYYLIGAITIFIIYGFLKDHINAHEALEGLKKVNYNLADYLPVKSPEDFVPHGAPKFMQNMVYGQFSDFSFVRYAGYTIMGGFIGAIIRKFEGNVRKLWFAALFFGIGLLFNVAGQFMFHQLDKFLDFVGIIDLDNFGVWVVGKNGHLYQNFVGCFENNATGFARLGQVAMLFGVLMTIDARFNVKAPLFLKMGQNTFPVYIVHVIILYRGIIGIGLDDASAEHPWYHHAFHPWVSVGISAFFITFFILMVKYIEPLTDIYNKVFGLLKFKRKKRS